MILAVSVSCKTTLTAWRFDADLQGRPSHQALVLICGSFKTALANAIKNLPERESLVMSLYYDEDLNLREIGEILGVSESRVCQIHGQALMRLKARLSDWTAEEPE